MRSGARRMAKIESETEDLVARTTCSDLLTSSTRSYVVAGGLRATFIVDYLHTVILFVVLYFFLFKI